jgi:hypothetical protein
MMSKAKYVSTHPTHQLRPKKRQWRRVGLTPVRDVDASVLCRHGFHPVNEFADLSLREGLEVQQGAVGEEVAEGAALARVVLVQGEADAGLAFYAADGAEEDGAFFHQSGLLFVSISTVMTRKWDMKAGS